MKTVTILAAGLLLSLPVVAIAETWECQAGTVWGERQIVVKATSYDNGSGAIEVAGTTHDTVFTVSGFNRVWSWERDADVGRYRYAFTVKPSGVAEYQDFRDSLVEGEPTASASQQFVCRDSAEGKLAAEPPVSNLEDMSPQEFQAWMDEALPTGYIKNPDTIAECASNRDLFRAQQLENIINMREFLEPDAVTKLAMSSEDQAQASYDACVALIECVEDLGQKACIQAIIESFESE